MPSNITGFHFRINNVQTDTFPLPPDCFTLERNRRFFVSVSDGRHTKETRPVLLHRRSLHWSDILDGFTVDPSSQLSLKVFEQHHIRKNNLLGTFVIPYITLLSSRHELVQSIDNSKKKKTPSRQIKVTWSERLPSYFSLVSIAEKHKADAVQGLAIGVGNVSNTAEQVLDPASKIVISMPDFLHKRKIVRDGIALIERAVDAIAEIRPSAKFAGTAISFIPEKISEQTQLDKNVMNLLDIMARALFVAPDTEAPDWEKLKIRCEDSDGCKKTIRRLLNVIADCGYLIYKYLNDADFAKGVKNVAGDVKRNIFAQLEDQLQKLHGDFINEVCDATHENIYRILAELKTIGGDVREVGRNLMDHDIDMKLDKLLYGEGTEFDPNKRCLTQTRAKFLDAIAQWVNDPLSPKVLALVGQAGTGKSSIANEIAYRYSCMNRLTTSYFFVRGNPSGREPYRFFTTLARDLCGICPAFKALLGRIISEKPELAHVRNYTTLVESLLRDPLKNLYFVGPVFIVIDALDENEDASHKRSYAGGNSTPFHTALLRCLSELPSNFRVLITSRPEAEFETAFLGSSSFMDVIYMNDPELAESVNHDILIYIQDKLRNTQIAQDNLLKLVKRAEGLFQWAFVACDYIACPPPGLSSKYCLENLLHTSLALEGAEPLDTLYVKILEAHFDMKNLQIRKNFHSILAQVLGTFEPLSITALNTMHQKMDCGTCPDVEVFDVVKHMGSLLSNVASTTSAFPIAPLHTSFRDFLTTESRSRDFYVNLDYAHDNFALAALRTMQTELKFNMCKLETSYLLNSEVPDLKRRIEDNIPSALSYSCRFWADHLARDSEFNPNVFQGLHAFMREKLLFWLEVLSVKGEMSIVNPALLSLQGWINRMHGKAEMEEINALVNDAIVFVRCFGYPIGHSAPHIYVSALPFTPSSSVISRLYTHRFSTFRLLKGGLTKWPAMELKIPVPDKKRVRCVTWSRDGKYVAAAVENCVYVWSASTRMRVSGPFHVSLVMSIAFSHDGRWLAVGLWIGGIRIWDVVRETEREVGVQWKAHRGHNMAVSAVAFAEDGKRLVFGLHDCTIRIWDLEKGVAVGEPFAGHNNPVWEVSYLDEEHILSRSGFRTVRVWNVKTRKRTSRTDVLTGIIHSTIRYDANLVSDQCAGSSFDVCSWNKAAESEEMGYKEDQWWSPIVAFSPNGKFVATCNPYHIHVWSAMTGILAGGPFNEEGVTCLAISPDGRRLASGSEDGTVRVWSVQLVDDGGTESSGGKAPSAVSFMPDNEKIVVGRTDGRVEVLDASTGREVSTITEGGHYNQRTRVAVSLNGNWIASTWDKEMYIWTQSGEVIAGLSDDKVISTVAFSSYANNLMAYGTRGGTVYILDASTGALVAGPKEISSCAITSLALSPSTGNGSTTMQTRLVVGTEDGHTSIWDTRTGNTIESFNHHESVRALAFSSNGTSITSAAGDYTLCIWDLSNGKVVRRPVKFSGVGKTPRPLITLTPDGRRVAFTGINHTILLFDVSHDSDIILHGPLVLAGHVNDLYQFAFSRDGKYLATPSRDRMLRIWDVPAALRQKQLVDSKSEIVNFDSTWIDNDGWAICTNANGPPSRLICVPDIHRNRMYRPSNVCVVGGHVQTRLDFTNFFHGKNWTKCCLSET